MNELALFAGAGGGILGGKLLGWRTRCAVEIDPYARRVLLARQRDGILPRFPIWDDVRTFDGKPWRGSIDVISGGFPCQDISSAGSGAGITGKRSGLWSEMARIVGEVVPRFVFVENSPMLTSRGLGVVHAGAPHKRDRIWILARHANSQSESAQPVHAQTSRVPGLVAHGSSRRHRPPQEEIRPRRDSAIHADWWAAEPQLGRVADGVAHRVDRLRAIGNGQVPEVVRLAWKTLI